MDEESFRGTSSSKMQHEEAEGEEGAVVDAEAIDL